MIFDLPKNESSIIKVLGVGGGGSNAVTHMYKQGIVGVDFALCNTDAQALDVSPVPIKMHLGPELTEGRGAGSKPQVGKQACMESIANIEDFLERDTKMLFITAGMGGGTGTGAAPIIAQAAREKDILTIGIVTVPFKFEGKRRRELAAQGLEELKKYVDTIVVVSNDKLREICGNLKISDAFAKADDVLTTAARAIAEIITVPGYVNVDFEDVNHVMRDSGVAILGNGVAEGDDRAIRAIDEALNSPLLEDNDIRGAQSILVNITSGAKEATMDEIAEINDFIQDEAGAETDLIWGNCFDESLGDAIRVTVIATGFERNHVEKVFAKDLEKPTVVKLDEKDARRERAYELGRTEQINNTVEFDDLSPSPRTQREHNRQRIQEERERQSYDPFEENRLRLRLEREKRMKNRGQRANLTKDLNKIENEPAYKRLKVNLDDELDATEVGEMSRHSINEKNEYDSFNNNSFLHDNVD